ncbi:exopolysaccharide biosynthesis protein [Zavarzinia sp.]|uniref:exopolysaccharide biosynthesis protein n=1 Tax=Zavarzinia sp. TaxID=2027920 RepID=UPI00356483A2
MQGESRPFVALLRRAIPAARFLEKLVHPRWRPPAGTTRRITGLVMLLLGVTMLSPIPLTGIAPALAITLISFADLERDGLLLGIACLAAFLLLETAFATVWGAF